MPRSSFEPDGLVVGRALRELRLPVWTSLQHAGQPLVAMQQSAPLWPLTWLGVIAPFSGARVDRGAQAHARRAGHGSAGRRAGAGTGPALLAALSFAFGTYLVDWLGHPHSNAYVPLAWLLLAAERLCRSGSVRDAGVLGLLTGLAWLGGQPESALLVTLPTAALVVTGCSRCARRAGRPSGVGCWRPARGWRASPSAR